jgi:hypothetical protein
MEKLIVRVHVAPGAPAMFLGAVTGLCSGVIHGQKFEVLPSKLLDPPDYDIASFIGSR